MEDKIKPLETAIFNAKQRRDKALEDMNSIKKGHVLDILELAKDKANKLTNATLRDAELQSRLEIEPEYQRLVTVVQTLETDIALMQIDLGFEKRKFQVWYIEELKLANGVE
jgi:Mg2+ and Co2+ transporter CorA